MASNKKKVVILGSTGSIGINTLRVISRLKDEFEVLGLSANDNVDLLIQQAKAFSVSFAAIGKKHVGTLKSALHRRRVNVLESPSDLCTLAAHPQADIVVMALSGRSALEPFLSAAKAGKKIAPANKEALVIAGDMIMSEAKKSGAQIIPVDSEQSAIFQCLEGRDLQDIDKILLTASGGALLNVPVKKFSRLTVKDILNHPRWKMGRKITVDSATMMNKGFEVIEAQKLFGLDIKNIEVLVHPEAIIHSMVSLRDGSLLAQLGVTDMQLPIQYALTYPARRKSGLKPLNLVEIRSLNFLKPDFEKFPCLGLAYYAAKKGGTWPAVLNAADEVAVDAFLNEQIGFQRIFDIVERVVLKHRGQHAPRLSDIIDADQWARDKARELFGDSPVNRVRS